MDLSALIFVALAVAWAVYLVPKAVRHHDEVARSRSVDRFSRSMRVLARREAVSSRDSRLVVSPRRAQPATVVVTKERVSTVTVETTTAASGLRSRGARRVAARRRRRVLGLLLVTLLAVASAAVAGAIDWWWTALPASVIVAWLVSCRVMVRAERRGASAAAPRAEAPATTLADQAGAAHDGTGAPSQGAEVAAGADGADQVTVTVSETVAGAEDVPAPPAEVGEVAEVAEVAEDGVGAARMWDPVPMTLPTYVEKERAHHRTVRTIDLDSTGVWTSGRSEIDSAIAREAEESERAARAEQGRREEQRRASGS